MLRLLLPISYLTMFGWIVASAHAAGLSITHHDPVWNDGKGNVPDKGICEFRGGSDAMSPSMKVSGIPKGTVVLELNFTDEDWAHEGAHGIIGFKISASDESVIVPSFKGEVDELPPNFEVVSPHIGSQMSGVYLPPCSGGRGHRYTVYIYAKNADGDELAKGKLPLGTY